MMRPSRSSEGEITEREAAFVLGPGLFMRELSATGEEYAMIYAGTTRILMSTAGAECVNAPTEMKSTPVSA